MKIETNGVVAVLREIMGQCGTSLDAVERSKYAATIIGTVIGATLDMPSTPVDIPRNYFLITHSERAACLVSAINEVFPVNVDLALSVTDNVFLTRYRLVFEPTFAVHMLSHLAKCSDDVVPTDIQDILCKVKDNEENICSLNNVLCNAIASMESVG